MKIIKKITLFLLVLTCLAASFLSCTNAKDPDAPKGYYEITKLYKKSAENPNGTQLRPTDFHFFVPDGWTVDMNGACVSAMAPGDGATMAAGTMAIPVSVSDLYLKGKGESEAAPSIVDVFWSSYYKDELGRAFGTDVNGDGEVTGAFTFISAEDVTVTAEKRPAKKIIYEVTFTTGSVVNIYKSELYIFWKGTGGEAINLHFMQLFSKQSNFDTHSKAFKITKDAFAFVNETPEESSTDTTSAETTD